MPRTAHRLAFSTERHGYEHKGGGTIGPGSQAKGDDLEHRRTLFLQKFTVLDPVPIRSLSSVACLRPLTYRQKCLLLCLLVMTWAEQLHAVLKERYSAPKTRSSNLENENARRI